MSAIAPKADVDRNDSDVRKVPKAEATGHHAYRTTPLPALLRVTFENSLSKVAATDQPSFHFSSADAVVNIDSHACAAPLTIKNAPGSV
jgi:hypothetical protein